MQESYKKTYTKQTIDKKVTMNSGKPNIQTNQSKTPQYQTNKNVNTGTNTRVQPTRPVGTVATTQRQTVANNNSKTGIKPRTNPASSTLNTGINVRTNVAKSTLNTGIKPTNSTLNAGSNLRTQQTRLTSTALNQRGTIPNNSLKTTSVQRTQLKPSTPNNTYGNKVGVNQTRQSQQVSINTRVSANSSVNKGTVGQRQQVNNRTLPVENKATQFRQNLQSGNYPMRNNTNVQPKITQTSVVQPRNNVTQTREQQNYSSRTSATTHQNAFKESLKVEEIEVPKEPEDEIIDDHKYAMYFGLGLTILAISNSLMWYKFTSDYMQKFNYRTFNNVRIIEEETKQSSLERAILDEYDDYR